MASQIPAWATVGATVYARANYRGDAELRKGIITRVTATSIFVRTNLAAGDSAGEDRYTMQRWGTAPKLHGSGDSLYSRTLVTEADGEEELAVIAERQRRRRITSKAAAAANLAGASLNPERAREAIAALHTYLTEVGE